MDRQTPIELKFDKLGPRVVEALKRRKFEAFYCPTAQEALKKAIECIPKKDVVSWGGSVTIQEIGLLNYIKSNGYTVIDRDTASNPQERKELMKQALHCDTFLMSSNAISEDGQLVNIDGNGNRVAAMVYGPDNVIVIAGMNKVVKTVGDALQRARTIAAPGVVQRFPDTHTPCYATGSCADCVSPECVCAYMLTTRFCRPAGKIKVILVGESLGL